MMIVNVMELPRPDQIEEMKDGLEATVQKQAEIRARIELMRAEQDGLRAKKRELDAERSVALVDGQPTTSLRGKVRGLAAQIEELKDEISELAEVADGWDAKIMLAQIKVDQARHGELAGQGNELVGQLSGQIEALKATVEEFDAIRREHDRCYKSIRRVEGAAVAEGIGGIVVSHRDWQAFVDALANVQRSIK